MEEAQKSTKFTLTINRQKGEIEAESKIDRYVIELKKSRNDESFGIIPTIDEDCVYFWNLYILTKKKDSLRNLEFPYC